MVLTGGPKLAEVGRLAGLRIPAGGARHQVAVTERHPDLDPARVPMVFDLAAGLYWRPEEGGLLFGMSNPDEPPGENREVDEEYLAKMRARLATLVPVTAGSGCAGSGRRRSTTRRITCPSSAARPGSDRASRWPARAGPA